MMAWLERFSPTPGRSARTSMPSSRRCACRPDARAHQECGRMDAAGASRMISRARNSLSSPSIRALTPVTRLPSNIKPVADGAVDDGEIAARAHRRIEIADRRRGALVRPVAHRHRAVAVAKIRVHVGDERDLPLLREGMHGLRQRRPVVRLGAADRHRPVLAVQLAGEIQLVLELAVERQHVVPAPTRRADALPIRRNRRAFRERRPCPSPRSRRP